MSFAGVLSNVQCFEGVYKPVQKVRLPLVCSASPWVLCLVFPPDSWSGLNSDQSSLDPCRVSHRPPANSMHLKLKRREDEPQVVPCKRKPLLVPRRVLTVVNATDCKQATGVQLLLGHTLHPASQPSTGPEKHSPTWAEGTAKGHLMQPPCSGEGHPQPDRKHQGRGAQRAATSLLLLMQMVVPHSGSSSPAMLLSVVTEQRRAHAAFPLPSSGKQLPTGCSVSGSLRGAVCSPSAAHPRSRGAAAAAELPGATATAVGPED